MSIEWSSVSAFSRACHIVVHSFVPRPVNDQNQRFAMRAQVERFGRVTLMMRIKLQGRHVTGRDSKVAHDLVCDALANCQLAEHRDVSCLPILRPCVRRILLIHRIVELCHPSVSVRRDIPSVGDRVDVLIDRSRRSQDTTAWTESKHVLGVFESNQALFFDIRHQLTVTQQTCRGIDTVKKS